MKDVSRLSKRYWQLAIAHLRTGCKGRDGDPYTHGACMGRPRSEGRAFVACAVALVACALGVAAASNDHEHRVDGIEAPIKEVRARRIVIVDDEGKTRVVLGELTSHNFGVAIQGPKVGQLIEISAAADGTGIRVSGEGRQARIGLLVGPDSSSLMLNVGGVGGRSATIDVDRTTGAISLLDNKGNRRASLMLSKSDDVTFMVLPEKTDK